jgi:hypothetical protein
MEKCIVYLGSSSILIPALGILHNRQLAVCFAPRPTASGPRDAGSCALGVDAPLRPRAGGLQRFFLVRCRHVSRRPQSFPCQRASVPASVGTRLSRQLAPRARPYGPNAPRRCVCRQILLLGRPPYNSSDNARYLPRLGRVQTLSSQPLTHRSYDTRARVPAPRAKQEACKRGARAYPCVRPRLRLRSPSSQPETPTVPAPSTATHPSAPTISRSLAESPPSVECWRLLCAGTFFSCGTPPLHPSSGRRPHTRVIRNKFGV